MTPRFPFNIQGIIEERASDAFISHEMDYAFREGWFFATAGDFNSFPSLLRDRERGGERAGVTGRERGSDRQRDHGDRDSPYVKANKVKPQTDTDGRPLERS
jgi:hypothetical protein